MSFPKTLQRYDEQIVFCKFFRKKMQKNAFFTFSYLTSFERLCESGKPFSHFLISRCSNDYVKAASHFHIFTFPRIAVSSIFAHNNYYII